MHFLEILTVCLRRKYYLIFIPLASAVIGFGISCLIPKSYYTEMRLRVDDPISKESAILPDIGKNLSSYFGNPLKNEAEELYVEVLTGRDNLVAAIKTFSLDTLYKRKRIDPTIKDFKKDLGIEIQDNNIITCGMRGENRELSIGVVKFLTNRANAKFIELQKERLALSSNFLSEKRQQLMDSIETLNTELITFYRENNVVNIQKQIELSLLALSSYEEEINSIKLGRAYTHNILGNNTPAEQELKNKLKVLRQEFRNLRGKYSDDYKPSRQSILINADWGLDKMLFEKILHTRIDVLRDFLIMISKELALSESQLSKNVPAIQIIQDAYYPDWKISPKRIIWTAVSFCIAFVGTLCYILLTAFLKGELNAADEQNRKKVLKVIEALKS